MLIIISKINSLKHKLRVYKRKQQEKQLYRNFIKQGDLCFDIGANVGNKSDIFLSLGAKVIALEPQPICVKRLKQRFGKNKQFICIPKGVSSEPGNLTLYANDNLDHLASFVPTWIDEVIEANQNLAKSDFEVKEIQVETTTLDQLITEYGQPSFCKIDVEGFELEVLKGLSNMIETVTFEYHLSEAEINKTIAVLEYLSGLSKSQLQVNLSNKGGNYFVENSWMSPDVFINFFTKEFMKRQGISNDINQFGDIFVTTKKLN